MARERQQNNWLRSGLVVGLICFILGGGSPAQAADSPPDYSRRSRYAVPEDNLYKSPVQLLLSRDGRQLFAACEGTDEVLVVDPRRRKVVGRVAVG